MGAPLDRITLKGFKSIRDLDDFPLGKLNVLIGPNGAGKSNFIEFFRMLRAMAEGRLERYVTEKGGADGIFFNGPKETVAITGCLVFGSYLYEFGLIPAVSGDLMFSKEVLTNPNGGHLTSMARRGGWSESRLHGWKDLPHEEGANWEGVNWRDEYEIYDAIASCTVYHFHDTGPLAPMRRERSVHDTRQLNPDASNIAAFLYSMRSNGLPSPSGSSNSQPSRARYTRIRETIQLVAPFFDDFLLEPYTKGQEELIRLQWRQKGSSFPFQPWHLSDGTLRFICLATALLQPNPPSTVVIDEPELGLHPFALEVLASLIREMSERTQVIVSTQSAPLLNYFEPGEVIVVDREAGASRFRHLNAESLKGWMEEYSLGELWQKNVLDGGPSHE